MAGIPTFIPQTQTECSFSLLLRLDDIKDPGLSEDDFQELFFKCRKCRWLMTRRVTVFHDCSAARNNAQQVTVIDLTNEE
jgi:hypothetical protein